MSTTKELIQTLYDKRTGVRAKQAELHAAMEADLNGETAEQRAEWDRMDAEFAELGERIDHLLTMEEQNRELNEQRERFEQLVRTPAIVEGETHALEERLRNFVRAGLPDAEVWSPSTITISLVERHDLTKGGAAGTGPELVPTGFVRSLKEHMIEFAGVRRTNAQIYQTSSGENLLIPKTAGYGTATLIAEGGPILENDPTFAQVSLGAYKFGQLIQVSRELVEDSAIDLVSFLGRAAGIAIGTATGGYYITGTGTSQPQGIANAPTAGKTGTTGSTVTVAANDLIDLYHSVISGYRAQGYWVMNDLAAAAVRKLRDDSGGAGIGNLMWQPGLQAGAPDTIFGRPVVTDPNMPVMAANAYSIAFGDFSAYFAIRDVNSVRFERSDDFAFANDLVTFRALFRTDSKQVINGANGAVKFYRNSAT